MNEKHSGLGIASFSISIAVGLMLLAVFAVAGILFNAHHGAGYPGQTLVGFATMGLLALDAVALALGIASVFQSGRNKVFGILGLVFSGLILLGTAGLVFIGLIASGRL